MSALVVYHADCVDGLGAAWCAWHAFGDDAEYVPAHYGDDPPDCAGRDVYVLDFSYPRDVLLRMAEQAEQFLVLDHHKTAQEALTGLGFARFDMGRSGARMAFDHFSDAQPNETELLVNYIQDRDLWRWSLPCSREVSAWLSSFNLTFSQLDDLSFMLATRFEACVSDGRAILRAADKLVTCPECLRIVRAGGFVHVPKELAS